MLGWWHVSTLIYYNFLIIPKLLFFQVCSSLLLPLREFLADKEFCFLIAF